MITCLLDASIIITNSLRSNSVIIMDYAVRTSPSTSANSCRKLMAGYLFIAVYTDVNGYSGEWLYYYLTFFINFICFLLFQQWFCLALSNVFITRTYVFFTHRFHNIISCATMIPDYPTIIILSICGLYIYARILDDGYGYTYVT